MTEKALGKLRKFQRNSKEKFKRKMKENIKWLLMVKKKSQKLENVG